LKEKDAAKHRWESIFYASRELFQEANFIATILKTQNYSANKPPLQAPSAGEGEYQAVPDKYPIAGGITQTKQPLQPVNTGGLKDYTAKYSEIITTLQRQATFNSIEMGDTEWPLSGTAIMQLGENKAKLMIPRLDAIAKIRRRCAVMRIRQAQMLSTKLRLGEPGHQRDYLPSDLDGSYSIKYRYYSMSATEMAAKVALANSMGSLVSEDYKRRETIKLQDPDGEKMRQRAELAESLDPVIGLIEQGLALVYEGTDESDIKARRIQKKIIGILKQEQLTESQPLSGDIERGSNVKQNPTQALPLFGGTQRR
jgi:hypothetical protein